MASYSADPADLQKVGESASQYGLKVEESSPARRTVRLSGAVHQMNTAFGVQLNTYSYSGRTYRSREGRILVPRNLADIQAGIRPHQPAEPAASTAEHQWADYWHRTAALYE